MRGADKAFIALSAVLSHIQSGKRHATTERIASDPLFRKRMNELAGQVMNLGPQQFTDYVKQETVQ